jgi:hypothetical protein
VLSYFVSLVLSLQAFVCSCDSLAFIICSDNVKCVTKFPVLDVFLATFLGDRFMLLKLSFCVSPALSLSANFFVRNLAVGLSRMTGNPLQV